MTTFFDAPNPGTTDPDDLVRLEGELNLAEAAIQPLRDELAIQTEGVAGPRQRTLANHRTERQEANRETWTAIKMLFSAIVAAIMAYRRLRAQQRLELSELNAKLNSILAEPQQALNDAIAHRDLLDRQVRTLKVRLADERASELANVSRPTWPEIAKPRSIQPAFATNGLAGYAMSNAQSLADEAETQLIEPIIPFMPTTITAEPVKTTSRRALPPRHKLGGVMIPIHGSAGTVLVGLAVIMAIVGGAAFASLRSGSPPPAPKAAPTQGPTKVQTTVELPKTTTQPVTQSAKPSASPSATPLTLDEAYSQATTRDSNLPIWIQKVPMAKKALEPWTPYLNAAVSDPATVYHTPDGQTVAVMGTQLTNDNGTVIWTHGHQSLMQLLILTGSGGYPAAHSGTYEGLIPMDITVAKATAHQMGIAYVPAANTIEAVRNNTLIATYRANEIFSQISRSKLFAETIKAVEAKHTADAKKAHTKNYVASKDPKVVAEESDLYTSTFMAIWYGRLDITGKSFVLKTGATKADLPILTDKGMNPALLNQMLRRLYLDWALPKSAQSAILFKLPSMKSLLSHAIKARATFGSR